jgi:hypothetical protein
MALAVSTGGVAAVLSMNGRLTLWNWHGDLLAVRQVARGIGSGVTAVSGDTFIVKVDLFPPIDVAEFRRVTSESTASAPFYSDEELEGIADSGQPYRNHAYALAGTPRGDLLLAPPGPEYLIQRVDPGGEAVQAIRRPEIGPLERSAREIEELRQRVKRGFAAAGRSTPREFSIPPYRSHIARLAVARDGTIWALTPRGGESHALVDAFDADGKFAGSYSLELDVADLVVGTGALYLLARSADGVPGIAVARRPQLQDGWARRTEDE